MIVNGVDENLKRNVFIKTLIYRFRKNSDYPIFNNFLKLTIPASLFNFFYNTMIKKANLSLVQFVPQVLRTGSRSAGIDTSNVFKSIKESCPIQYFFFGFIFKVF